MAKKVHVKEHTRKAPTSKKVVPKSRIKPLKDKGKDLKYFMVSFIQPGHKLRSKYRFQAYTKSGALEKAKRQYKGSTGHRLVK